MKINQYSFMEILYHPVIRQFFYFWQVFHRKKILNSYLMDKLLILRNTGPE
jgi:hypothetical protein